MINKEGELILVGVMSDDNKSGSISI
jgi:hypothetical protein